MKEVSQKISNRHWKHRERACDLRSKGWSYKEIMGEVPVAKSTISLWCRHVALTGEQRKRLQEKRPQTMKGIKTIQTHFWKKRCDAFDEGARMYGSFKDSHFFIGGLMLYWAEGNKQKAAGFANSDPRAIRYIIKWFCTYFDVSVNNITLHLHLHSGQSEENMKQYWSQLTGVPLINFYKSFIKKEGSGYRKNVLYNGTVQIRIRGESTYRLFRIVGALAAYLHESIGEKMAIEHWIPRLPYAEKYMGR